MSMELKVKEFTFPEVIEFNFDEIKQELQQKMKQYENLVYTDDQVQVAKTDLANLRKFVKALSNERIRIKNECLKPYTEFETKINELDAIVQKPIEQINNQVKSYEEETKKTKKEQIVKYFEEHSPYEWLKFEQIFNEKWLNATVKLPGVEKEIIERITQIRNDLLTLSNLPNFSFEATEIYKQTLDINRAITEGQKLEEMQKRKAEAVAKEKAEAEAKARAEVKAVSVEADKTETTEFTSVKTPIEPTKQWISFSALLSTQDAIALKQFFDERNIEFKKI